MKLYIYEHCPYCVKARMIFGLKNVPVELVVLLNDDDKTPAGLIGRKMVPVLQKEDGSCMPESMDIVHYIDNKDNVPLLTGKRNPEITSWLHHIHGYVDRLLFPHIAAAPFDEFATPQSRDYFIHKKQASIGDFGELKQHFSGLIKKVTADLRHLDTMIIKSNAVNGELSEDDIDLFPLLRNLTLVAGIAYPSRVADYRDNLAKQTQINLLFSKAGHSTHNS